MFNHCYRSQLFLSIYRHGQTVMWLGNSIRSSLATQNWECGNPQLRSAPSPNHQIVILYQNLSRPNNEQIYIYMLYIIHINIKSIKNIKNIKSIKNINNIKNVQTLKTERQKYKTPWNLENRTSMLLPNFQDRRPSRLSIHGGFSISKSRNDRDAVML